MRCSETGCTDSELTDSCGGGQEEERDNERAERLEFCGGSAISVERPAAVGIRRDSLPYP